MSKILVINLYLYTNFRQYKLSKFNNNVREKRIKELNL